MASPRIPGVQSQAEWLTDYRPHLDAAVAGIAHQLRRGVPTLTHVTERDIDLLLVEELYDNLDFVVWLAARAGFVQKNCLFGRQAQQTAHQIAAK